MFKSCSKCGKIHNTKFNCRVGINYKKYEDSIRKLRYTSRWRMTSERIKEESKHLCAVCLDIGAYTYTNLEVHHITKLRDDTSLFLDSDNLICLCRYHHLMADKGYLKKEYLCKLAKKRNVVQSEELRKVDKGIPGIPHAFLGKGTPHPFLEKGRSAPKKLS